MNFVKTGCWNWLEFLTIALAWWSLRNCPAFVRRYYLPVVLSVPSFRWLLNFCGWVCTLSILFRSSLCVVLLLLLKQFKFGKLHALKKRNRIGFISFYKHPTTYRYLPTLLILGKYSFWNYPNHDIIMIW